MAKRLSDVRVANQTIVFDLLRRQSPLTRTEIVEKTGLTVPTVSAILRELEEQSLVHPVKCLVSTGGRRAEAFSLNGNAHWVLAVHVAVQGISAALVNMRGEIVGRRDFARAKLGKRGEFVKKVYEVVDQMLANPGVPKDRILGVGLSIPGVVDDDNRIILSPNLGGEGLDFSEVETTAKLPLFIDNDARLGALAEVWWNKQLPPKTLVFIMADYGVGAGLAIDGKLHAGKNAAAGDIGHAVIDPRGRRCDCGQFGCLETFVSYPALLRKITDEARMGRPTRLLPEGAEEPIVETLDEIIDAALAGDELAVESIEDAGRYLAIAVSMLNVLVAPDVVYIGGTISRAYEILIKTMNEVLQRRGPELHRRGLRVLPAAFRQDNSLMGAAALAYQKLLGQDVLLSSVRGEL